MDNIMKSYIDTLSTDIKEVEGYTEYKELFNSSYRIGLEHLDMINTFYEGCGVEGIYRCMHHPCFNECTKNFRIRFMILKVDEDYVYVPLKITDNFMQKHTYVSIAQNPISINGIEENERKARLVLCSKPFVEYDTIISEDESLVDIDTMFYNKLEDFKYLDTGKWRSKHGINKLSKIIDVVDGDEYGLGLEGLVLEINKIWNEYKLTYDKLAKSKKTMTVKEDSRLAQLYLKSDQIKCYVFLYKGKPIGYTFLADVLNGKGVMSLATKQVTNGIDTLKNYYGGEDENLYLIHKSYSDYVQYYTNKVMLVDEGKEVLYNPGGAKSYSSGLYHFKKVYYRNVIVYRRVSCKEG